MAFAILFVFLHRTTGGAKHRPHSLLRPQRWLKQQNDRALMNNNGWLIDTLRFSRLTPGEQDSLANMLDYSDACRLVEGF